MQRCAIGRLFVFAGSALLFIGGAGHLHAQQAQKVPPPTPLTGTRWMLAESAGKRVAQNGLQPYFELKAVERYEDGSAGNLEDATDECGNGLTGTYRVTGDRLHVRIASSTLVACMVPASGPRPDLDSALAGSVRFRIVGSELDLLESNGVVRARFVAARGE
jgi:heat shock protein HslJ